MNCVPLSDDFGDWATPKEPTAGHFFSLLSPSLLTFSHTGAAGLPRQKPLSAGAV